jgi:amino acid adenylation domain-containing protein/non-ribosomal peptide synthase protein (TIGR01720 family)
MTDSYNFDSQEMNNPTNSERDQEVGISDDVYIFPTSFAQKRLWFLDQFDQGSPFYNIPTAVRLRGKFDVDIFDRCLNEITSRHETLRTTFEVLDDEPVQVIAPEAKLSIPFIDLTELPKEHRESQAMRLANEEARKPFNLSKGPLLRVSLIKITDEEHVVLLTMHHIVSDGWSMGVLVAEISTLYAAYSRNLPSPLPELSIQYADFAEWQQSWLTGDVLDTQLEYWNQKLGGDVPVLELPTDRPRPAVFSSIGGAISGSLSKELTEGLKELSRRESATLYMILLAGLDTIIYRYANQDDITVGSPMANRTRAEVEGLIGVFINTLVFRADLSGNPTFREMLRRVRESALGAFAHQDLPFEMLVEELQVDRDMSRTPLFQVMLILQNAPTGGQQPAGLSMEAIDIHMGTSTFDLTFSIAETVNGMDVSIEYNSDIFDESTIERMLEHYRKLLEAIVENPDLRLDEIPILTDDECQQILVEWNDTITDFPPDIERKNLCVHQLFERQAVRMQDEVAIVAPALDGKPRAEITYAELDSRANALAAYLRRYGLDADLLVGICTDRSLEMFIAIMGVLKAGGAYLPIDPIHPQDRLAYILEDSRVTILLTQESLLDRLPDHDAQVICIDAEWREIMEVTQEELEELKNIDASPDDLVYMTYTSGSTGQSKGVMIQHRSLVNSYLAWEEAYTLENVRSHLQMANFTFDVFSGDLVRALLSGGKLVLCPREWLLDPERLYRLIIQEQIDCAEFVPAVLRHLVEFLDKNNQRLDTLRVLACGSDSWYVGEYLEFLKVMGSETHLINSFGLTEVTIDSTYFEGSLSGLSVDQMVPIGRPFSNTQLYILDRNLQPTPIGVPGELHLGGPGVALGYHDRPEMTAEKFIPNPFIDMLGEDAGNGDGFQRLYKTGDLARYLTDGNVEFLGRIDEQLKLRGYRIEPGEIESVLGSYPLVHGAAVLAVEIQPGDKRLVAYLEQEGDLEPAAGDLRRHVQERLPDYMVPSAFVVMDSLPLNASGKIDRRALAALPPPDLSRRELSEEYVPPSSPVQEKLSAIWAQVLGIRPSGSGNGDGAQAAVGIYDNFFELGGHSLLATQLISRVREGFKVEIALRHIFDSPTIATFSEHVEIALSGGAGVEAPPIVAMRRDPVTGLPAEFPPLSFAQQRLWFLDQLEPGSPFYNLPDAVRLTGPLNEDLMEKSLNEVVRRHESLRTTFQVIDGKPVQVVVPEYELTEESPFYIKLPIDDLRSLPETKRETEAMRIARQEAQQPFDLAKGPLLRARLVRLKGDIEQAASVQSENSTETFEAGDNGQGNGSEPPEYIVLLTMHHIVGDNWSSNVLIQEIAVIYDTFSREMPALLPPLPIQYPDFSFWQRNWLQGEVLEAEINHWTERLAGIPPLLELPTDRPRPPVQTFNGDYHSFVLPEDLSRGVRSLSQEEGVTIFMMLLAAFQTILYRYSGEEDISIGTPIANRNRVEIENLIGFFVNTLVLRGDMSGDPTFRELLQRVRETAIDAYAHQDVPFEMIVDAMQPDRDLSHTPLFQVMFALQSSQMVSQTLPSSGLLLSPVEAHSGTSKFDLTLFMVEEEMISPAGPQYNLSGAMEYNTDLFDTATIERMMEHFRILLDSIVANPDQPISTLSMLSEVEINQLIVEWNRTMADSPQDLCAHQLFEAQVIRTPDDPAVKMHPIALAQSQQSGIEQLTYAELNTKANQVAHYLQIHGVVPDTLVGLCMDRSLEMVISLMGILKAGGAYLPLDSTYPRERLAFMIKDSRIPILLTQENLLSTLPINEEAGEDIQVICIDRDWNQIDTEVTALPYGKKNPISYAAQDNLAYVIYTSGSTGRPKGAMIEHRGLVNYLTWVERAYPLAKGQGAPVHSSISFDLTVTGMFGPLVSGGCVTLLPEGLSVENLGETLRVEAESGSSDPFSLIKITPAHLQLLGEQLSPEEASGRSYAFIIGGENLLDEHIEFWQINSPETELVNEYGPTETVVGCCVYWVPTGEEHGEQHPTGIIPIGRPIINTQLYILDQYQQPVPIGVPGELYIGGAGVARGYLNRPALSAECFIPNPFVDVLQDSGISIADDDRLYKTGDLASYLPDGNIKCLGRIDFQVKIRGFRVELGEVESVLAQHDHVSEVVVWAREDRGSKRLVAYIVPETDEYLSDPARNSLIIELRQELQKKLPEYMMPAAFMMLNALPLTPNGKVDRNALPAPELVRVDLERESVPPRNPQEEIIAAIWLEVLGMDLSGEQAAISVYDNFFDLGGHSLLATQVISRLRDAFSVEVPLRMIFEAPTIAGMAVRVDQARQEVFGLLAPPIEPLPRDERTGLPISPLPLSFAQQRLWFLEQLDPGNPFYNTPAAVRLKGSLNIEALERSLNAVLSRHESLRTTFGDIDGRPVQVIAPEMRLKLDVKDLQGESHAERELEAIKVAAEDALLPFDLEAGPLLRVSLVQVDEDEYIVLLNMHHIISDDWSLGIFIQEIATLYSVFSTTVDEELDIGALLPPMAIQYADYAAWQRNWLKDDILETQLDYWRQQLAGSPPLLEMPLDRPRPAVQTFWGAQKTFDLDTELSSKLNSLGREEGTTLFMVLLAAFQTLLYRYTGQDDISVGTPIANRTRAEIEGLIGFFVNTLVMRTDLSGSPTFRALLGKVRDVALGAYTHQDVPFEMLVDELQPDRDMSHSPLFQVMMVLQNAPRESVDVTSDMRLSTVEAHNRVARFDITLSFTETPGGISGALEYNTDLYNEDTIDRMVAHFNNLLAAVASNPDQQITSFPILSDVEKRQILVDWNNTSTGRSLKTPVHELFEDQVASNPDATALLFEDQELSYYELNRRANQLAHHLRAMGVGPETIVGISVERSIEMIVGLIGILKAGGAFLPIDPLYPEERIAFMLQDAQVQVLLTQERLLEKTAISKNEQTVVCLDSDWEEIERGGADNPRSGVRADNLAYVIYTSGSTGRPKGVMLRHRGLTNLSHAQSVGWGIDAHSRVLQFASVSFDASVSEIFNVLSNGAVLILARQETLTSIPDLLDLMRTQSVTLVTLPPSVLKELPADDMPDLKTLISAGESCTPDIAEKWSEGRQFINAYGPTETTIGPTYHLLKDIPSEMASVPIGKPIDNYLLYILDDQQQPVPVGVPGELCIGGIGVARGYLNRPELTAEKFIPNPFLELQENMSEDVDTRVYRTGDLARYLPDGNVEFLGRIDHQVKVRGFRIELGEIEASLAQHPAINAVVVLAREDVPGDQRLVAYIVPVDSPMQAVGEIRRYLQETLPEYMIPSVFIEIEEIPLTPNAKVDRRALPAPEYTRPELENVFVAPRTPTEEMLAAIWAQVLGLDVGEIGVLDNFFELGGHSLLATQVNSRVGEAFQVELPLRSLFDSPIIASFADEIEIAQQNALGVLKPPIERLPRDEIDGTPLIEPSLSFAQQRMWFLYQLEPDVPFYNLPGAFRLKGQLDINAFEKSINEVVKRHEVLRTRIFTSDDGQAAQEIVPDLALSMPVVDLTGLESEVRERELVRLAQEEAQKPFRLEELPLLRVSLVKLAPEDHVILMNMHHIVSDGWSMGIFAQEIVALYDAYANARPLSLPELPIQYADYAHWQRGWLRGEVLAEQLDYWREQMAGVPPMLELPTDRPRPPVQTFNGMTISFELTEELSRAIKRHSQEEGTTLYMTLLAVYQILLYRYSGQEDISVGTPIANRTRAEVEGLIGFFVNTLVMRTKLGGDPGFREVLRRVREVALGAYAHQDIPFEMLVDELAVERNISHSPLFQVVFTLQAAPTQTQGVSRLAVSSVEAETGISKFDMSLTIVEEADRLSGSIEFNTDLFDVSTIQRLVAHYQELLEGVVADPTQSISSLPLLRESEEQQMLHDWNDTFVDHSFELCVHQMFEEQVEKYPDTIALDFEGELVSYKELNRRANQLANYLRKFDVGPEKMVGICLEKSIEMIVAVFGVLKAGGGYVPLDPEYPIDRLKFMIEDAQVSALISYSELIETLDIAVIPVVQEEDWEKISREGDENQPQEASLQNLAYVIYTSGSTGLPKGVMIQHEGLVNLVYEYQDRFNIGPGVNVLQFFSFAFDGSVIDIFASLLTGGTLCIPRRETIVSIIDLYKFIKDHKINFTVITPSSLAVLPSQDLPDLTTLLTGGEACTPELVQLWSKGRRYFNVYGPTETTVVSTAYFTEDLPHDASNVPIGKPIGNTSTYILDRSFRPVPIGVPGELCVGGVGVARGYLNRAELSAERFIPDVYGEVPGARLYRTGDLARYLPDGDIEYLGRIDFQVKVRGFRIELGEIEAVLEENPDVRSAIVIVREDTPGHKRLVAYLVPEGEVAPSSGELRSFLGETLPDYMIPASFVTLEELPLTSSGKVDRRALPEPEATRVETGVEYVAPRTPMEETLVDIWARLLGVEQISIHDNFFEIGGDSIVAIQMIARAKQADIHFSPKLLFQYPTIDGIASHASAEDAVHAEQGIVTGELPLTPIQKWFFEHMTVEPHQWNTSMFLELSEPLDIDLIEKTIEYILQHHDALRLRFERINDEWQQFNGGVDDSIPFSYYDYSEIGNRNLRKVIETEAAQLQASLKLSEGPLMRVAYFDTGPERCARLLFIFHHLVMDGYSWRIFLEDFQVIYGQLSVGMQPTLPPKTSSYLYWSTRLKDYAQLPEIVGELPHWQEIGTKESPRIPVDNPEGANTFGTTEHLDLSLTEVESQALLQAVPAAYGAQINDVLLTALVRSMRRFTGKSTLMLEMEGHGREDILEGVDISRTIGWFTTTFPVLIDTEGVDELSKQISIVSEQVGAIPNHGIGFGMLRELCEIDEIRNQLASFPDAEINFNYLGQFDQMPETEWVPFRIAKESVGPEQSPQASPTALLYIVGIVSGGALHWRWLYSTKMYNRKTIKRFAEEYLRELRIIIESVSPESVSTALERIISPLSRRIRRG